MSIPIQYSLNPVVETVKRSRPRSFVLRQGRLSKAQARALEECGPTFCIAFQPYPLDLEKTFGRDAPKILEIGFGMGAATAEIAAHSLERDFLGIEVHTPGVGSLLKLIQAYHLPNIRIIQHDAVAVVETMLMENTLDGVHIFFPDPWHKKRHHKRRLIQLDFVRLLASRIKPAGYLHLATDWEDYAIQMLDVLSKENTLKNTVDSYAPRPTYRPLTRFEHRGISRGHSVFDLVFLKR